jgi:NAD(P)-dependent dehydrogenase (short-subunit alcohol dehydrogenase family)
MYLQKYDLNGRTAVVTGGGQGIGFACAEALGEAGAKVVVAELLADRVEKAVAELRAKGYAAEGATLNVTDSAAVEAVAEKFPEASILVNNAGIADSNVRAEDTSDAHWHKHIAVNLDGLFWCCRSFGKRMLANGSGSIVNIGSMSGFIVNKPQPQAFYNASKAAVHHLTKSLAAEWGDRGVRVNAVAPTYIDTPLTKFGSEDPIMGPVWIEMTPMKRLGLPEEIASVVLFLASDAASLLTGSIVLADGGYTCW